MIRAPAFFAAWTVVITVSRHTGSVRLTLPKCRMPVPEMARIAAGKYPPEQVRVICGDVETERFDRKFDVVMVYNAFPHFADPRQLICNLCSMLASGGILTVAHGMSREKVNSHHGGSAASISEGLMPAEELADLFARHLEVTCVVSDGRMYQVCGRAR